MKHPKKEIVANELLSEVCAKFEVMLCQKHLDGVNRKLMRSIFDFNSHADSAERIYAIKMVLELLYGVAVTTSPMLPKRYPPHHFFFYVTVEQFSKETGFDFVGEFGNDGTLFFCNSFEALVFGIGVAIDFLNAHQ